MRPLVRLIAVAAALVGVYFALRSAPSAADAEAAPTEGISMAAADRATPPAHDYTAQLEAYSGHGEWVKYNAGDGAEIQGYIAFPERPDAAPGVIVIHEIFGMSDWIRTVVHEFAARGYVALAPDLLSRVGGTQGADDARTAIRDLDPDKITADLDATKGYLRSLESVRGGSIAVIGFCWGGAQTFRYATNAADIGAAIVCYGSAPDTETLARIKAPVLGVYAENDARINGALPEVEAAMRAAGKSFQHEIYPGANHGFLRSRNVPDEADRAWEDIMAFLAGTVGN